MEALWGNLSRARHWVSLTQHTHSQRLVSWTVLRSSSSWTGIHSQNSITPTSRQSYSFHNHQTSWSRTLSTTPDSLESVPPNLKIDERSSFFPVTRAELLGEKVTLEDDYDDDVEDEELDGEESVVDGEEEEDEGDLDDADIEELFIPQPEVHYAIPLPDRLHVPIYKFSPEPGDNEVGTLWLNETVFGRDPIRVDLMKKAVVYFRNKKRGRRKAKTKTIAEVRGSGRKLRSQKGSGRARVGHSRPPHFRGGAKAHGPKNETDYGKTKLNKKVRKKALISALSQKLLEGNLILINQLYDITSIKTRETAKKLKVLGDIGGKMGKTGLILDDYWPLIDDSFDAETAVESYHGVPTPFKISAGNIPRIMVGSAHDASVYNILKYEKLVLTLACVKKLEYWLKDY